MVQATDAMGLALDEEALVSRGLRDYSGREEIPSALRDELRREIHRAFIQVFVLPLAGKDLAPEDVYKEGRVKNLEELVLRSVYVAFLENFLEHNGDVRYYPDLIAAVPHMVHQQLTREPAHVKVVEGHIADMRTAVDNSHDRAIWPDRGLPYLTGGIHSQPVRPIDPAVTH